MTQAQWTLVHITFTSIIAHNLSSSNFTSHSHHLQQVLSSVALRLWHHTVHKLTRFVDVCRNQKTERQMRMLNSHNRDKLLLLSASMSFLRSISITAKKQTCTLSLANDQKSV